MLAVDIAEVELALHTKHQAAGLEVTAGLAAADKGAVVFTTKVGEGGADRVLRYPRLSIRLQQPPTLPPM
jgi:hypothetical protein